MVSTFISSLAIRQRQRNCNSKVATFIYAFFDYDVVPSVAPFFLWTIKFKVMVDFSNQFNESTLFKLGTYRLRKSFLNVISNDVR